MVHPQSFSFRDHDVQRTRAVAQSVSFDDTALAACLGEARRVARGCLASVLQEAPDKLEYSSQFGSHPGNPRFLRAIDANISELLRSLDKPPLAELPFFLGC